MKRANVTKWLGVSTMLLFVLSVVLLSGAEPASAQNMKFGTLHVRAQGTLPADRVISASAILAATDADKDIGTNLRDGALLGSSPAINVIRSIWTYHDDADDAKDIRPIIANLESFGSSKDQISMIGLVEGVDPDLASGISSGAIDPTSNALINAVTATFSRQLFAAHTSQIYSNVHPNYATPIASGSTSVLVRWDLGLIVDATAVSEVNNQDVLTSQLSLNATMYIDGGGSVDKVGPSNVVGLETGPESQPQFSLINGGSRGLGSTSASSNVSIFSVGERQNRGIFGMANGIFIYAATDNTTGPAHGTNDILVLDPAVPLPGGSPFQFRRGDEATLALMIEMRSASDGEPNEYFGERSDLFNFDTSGVGQGVTKGFKVSIDTDLSGQNAFNEASGAITYRQAAFSGPASDFVIIDISAGVNNQLLTVGEHQSFNVIATMNDEVGSVSQTQVAHFADTAPPFISQLSLRSEDGGAEIGSATGVSDEAILSMGILTNGENNTTPSINNWLQAAIALSARNRFGDPVPSVFETDAGFWNNPGDIKALANYPDLDYTTMLRLEDIPTAAGFSLRKTVAQDLVPNIPDDGNTVFGAKVTVRLLNNNSTVTVRSAGVILRVTDDGRNQAVAYSDRQDPNSGSFVVDTNLRRFSVTNFQPQGSLANQISPATVEVDNAPPLVLDVTHAIMAFPTNYWNFTASTNQNTNLYDTLGERIFSLLRQTDEALNNSTFNASILTNRGFTAPFTTGAIGDATRLLLVERGTAARSNGTNRTQGGSPVQLVVAFDPTTNPEDGDWLVAPNANGRDLVNGRFKFDLANATLGYVTGGTGRLPAGFSLTDATLVFDSRGTAGVIGYATFNDWTGIPGSNLLPADGSESEQISVDAYDRLINVTSFDDDDVSANSLVIDTKSPNANFAGSTSQLSGLKGGTGAPASTLTYIVNSNGLKIADYANSVGFDPNDFNFASDPDFANQVLNNVGDADPVTGIVNDATGTNVQAGYMLVVQANFDEVSTLPSTSPFVSLEGSEAGFPFIIENQGSLDAAHQLDDLNTLFGQQARTISADFRDFVLSDTDVLPDVVQIIDFSPPDDDSLLNQDAANAEPNDVVRATWFYTIDPSASLNTANLDVRFVTFAARDLSGNYKKLQAPVARGRFSQPLVQVLEFNITSPRRGVSKSVIQRDPAYGPAPDQTAKQISAATMNVEDTSLQLVVRIGDGVNRGGPFVNSNFIQADFSQFGSGNRTINPSVLTDHDGRPVGAGSTVSGASILWATFNFGPVSQSNIESADDSGGAANRFIVVSATAENGAVQRAQTVGIQNDYTRPNYLFTQLVEMNANGQSTILTPLDSPTDNEVRPGQIVSVTSAIQIDNFERTVPLDLWEFGWDLSQFSFTGIPTVSFRKFDASNVAFVTATFQIPRTVTASRFSVAVASATDPAKNIARSVGDDPERQSQQVALNAARPVVQSSILSASNFVNYATDQVTLIEDGRQVKINAWRHVGTRKIDAGDERGLENQTATLRSTVRNGDMLRVVAQISITDPKFTELSQFNVTGNFSQVSGPSAGSVPPTQITKLGSIISATWEHYVANSQDNDAAVVIIEATNPVGLVSLDKIQTFPVRVDNTPPEVSAFVRYYENSALKSGEDIEVNPTLRNATASLIVTATYTDAGDGRGYAGSILSAIANGLPGAIGFGATDAWFTLESPVDIVNPANNTFNKRIYPTFWSISNIDGGLWSDASETDGPIVTSGSDYNSIAARNLIGLSTNFVLTAWYSINPFTGGDPTGQAIRFAANASRKDAALIVSVSDVVGNKGRIEATPRVEIDGVAPRIWAGLKGNDKNEFDKDAKNLFIDVAPGQTPWVDYIPPVYAANGQILRPTRVAPGAMVQGFFFIEDQPDTRDNMSVDVQGNDFKMVESSFSIINLPTETYSAYSLDNDNQFSFNLFPSVANLDIIPVTFQFRVGDNPATTNRLVTWTGKANDAVAAANYKTSGLAFVVASASDNVANKSQNAIPTGGVGIEVDSEGPGIIASSVFSVNSKAILDNLVTVPPVGATDIKALSSNWLVWAATIVVDGTEEEHFPLDQFNVDWSDKFEIDVNRLVPGSNVKGSRIVRRPGLVESSTRTIRFVTNAVQIREDSDPNDAQRLKVTMADALGNVREHTTGPISIQAIGPVATDISLNVNGIAQAQAGTTRLGIGQQIDSRNTAFEFNKHGHLIIEATITTAAQEIPDTILADLSDLFPAGLKDSVDEVPPTSRVLTPSGVVYARWENIAYDHTGLFAGQNVQGPSQWFLDQGVIRQLANDPSLRLNGPIPGATPINFVDPFGAPGASSTGLASAADTLSDLFGLPQIFLQTGATAKSVASITITVDDEDSLFAAELASTVDFTVDTKPPRASYTWDITRNPNFPPATQLFTSGPRIGFPSAPNVKSDIPSRVRQDDSVAVIVDVTNALIDNSGNDLFRINPNTLPEDRVFPSIDAVGNTVDILVDLLELNGGSGNDSVSGILPPNNLTVIDRGAGVPSLIKGNYFITVGADRGTTAVASRTPVGVTITVSDDAGNMPRNTIYDDQIVRRLNPNLNQLPENSVGIPLAVDNTPPSINGSIIAQIISGGAERTVGGNTIQYGPGQIIPDGAIIFPDTVMDVTVTVTDLVDNPLDILNNPNYGTFALVPLGLKLPVGGVQIKRQDARLTGSDSIRVPFQVTTPGLNEGRSTDAFRFIIRATDTIGNTAQRQSIESFKFDGVPDVEYAMDGVVLTPPVVINVNSTSSPVTVSARALDVGGLDSVEWTVDTTFAGIGITSFDSDGVEHADLAWDITDARERGTLDLVLNIPISKTEADSVVGFAIATDVDGNDNSAIVEEVTININQPAIIHELVQAQAVNDAGVAQATPLIDSLVGVNDGYDTAGADVREVTIPEGALLTVNIGAVDANGDPISFTANGTALTDESVRASSFVDNGDGTSIFEFEPGYRVVTGTDKFASFDLSVRAQSVDHAPDVMNLLVNVVAKAATPTIEVLTVLIDDTEQDPSQVEHKLPEGSQITYILQATDAGDEPLLFETRVNEAAKPRIVEVQTQAIPGIVDATISFQSNFEDAGIPERGVVSPVDPLTFEFIVQNATVSNNLIRVADILNVSVAPLVSATASVNGGPAQVLSPQAKLGVDQGDTVVVDFRAFDPDRDPVQTPIDQVDFIVSAAPSFTYNFQVTAVRPTSVDSQMTLNIPANVALSEAIVTVTYIAKDVLGNSRSVVYTIEVQNIGVIPSPYDELIVSQGYFVDQPTSTIHVKNIDPLATIHPGPEPNRIGNPIALTSVLHSMGGVNGNFKYNEERGTLGGDERPVYTSIGDVDGDGDLDIVVTLGVITDTARFPNIVVAKDARTREVIGNSFVAFQQSEEGVDDPLDYDNGEIRTAVGNFLGVPAGQPHQIATAHGFGGNHKVRIYQYTGQPAPNGFGVVAQFDGLVGGAATNNENGGQTLAAGDLDGDGVDELIIGQTNSDTSRTQFTVIKLNANGSIASRVPGVAFFSTNAAQPRRWHGEGGVEITVGDLNGDGQNELIFGIGGSLKNHGDSRDLTPGSILTVVLPRVENGVLTGYDAPGGNRVLQVLNDATNPSGAISITSIEANGIENDGRELAVSTGAVLSYTPNDAGAFDISSSHGTAENPIQSKYSIIRLDFNGQTIGGFSSLLGPRLVGVNAFINAGPDITQQFNPPSGQVFLSAGNTDARVVPNP